MFGLIAIPVLIAVNGFFVAVEFALVAVRKTRVEELVQQGVRGARAVAAAQANLNRSIAAAQLGITLASIALGAVGESVLARLLEPVLTFIPEGLEPLTRHSLATLPVDRGHHLPARHPRASRCPRSSPSTPRTGWPCGRPGSSTASRASRPRSSG